MPTAAQAAARTLLHDWNDGRIPYFTMPPQRDTHGHAAAAVVSALGQEFDVDQVRLLCLFVSVTGHGTLLLSCASWLMRAGTPLQCKLISCLDAMTARQEAFKAQMCRQHPNTCLLHFAVLHAAVCVL